ncbi:hypothetical protein [Paraferrimonas sp. SM1919]|uniref:hypothetical protein n=1 Tax=Paraferrimonas sp. SM1919 TaxID=2662263 RepID=UPI0013D4DC07|nr:hypothetical protein [Paraferrimonas sp. SM1919]
MKKWLLVAASMVAMPVLAQSNGGYRQVTPDTQAQVQPEVQKQPAAPKPTPRQRRSTVGTGIGGTQVGIAVGEDSGVAFRYQGYQATIGLNRFSVAVDKTFRFSGHPHFYWGIGGKLRNDYYHKLAARAVFGASAQVEDFVFFGELQPTLYLVNDTKLQLEGVVGVRYAF